MDKMFEDMMGDDWRTFRAKLVAQEHLQGFDVGNSSCQAEDANGKDEGPNVGNILAGAISSIFNGNRQQGNEKHQTKSSLHAADDTVMLDPFVGPEEMPILAPVELNRHRWAHQINHIEPGCVLVANEKLGGVFHQTVVLILDHNEHQGSTGIVINRPLPGTLMQIAAGPESKVDVSLRMAFNGANVSYGGPVMQDDFSVLHGWGEVEGARKVAPGVFVGGSSELAYEVRQNNFHPSNSLFVKGHAAWVPNQLSREVARGVWYIASVSSDFILRYAGAGLEDGDNPDDLWSDILMAMGGKFSKIAKHHSGPGDKRMKLNP